MLQTVEQSHLAALHHVPPSRSSLSASSSSASLASLDPLASSSMAPASHHHHHHHQHHPILIVTGPAGCGKTTVARYLVGRHGFTYIEGDEYHPQANIDKMSAGTPLDDEDRWDWLIVLRDQALNALKQGAKGVVVTCSALKKKYRDVIRTGRLYFEDPSVNIHFLYLRADKQTLIARVRARKGHYMKDAMVESQFAALEEPDEAECEQVRDVEVVDVTGNLHEVQRLASSAVDSILASQF